MGGEGGRVMIKYKAIPSWFNIGAKITPVEVERETESSVWVKGRRSKKRTDFENYYDTWEQARDAFIHHAERAISSEKALLARYEDSLLAIQSMTKPDGAA